MLAPQDGLEGGQPEGEEVGTRIRNAAPYSLLGAREKVCSTHAAWRRPSRSPNRVEPLS